jgi:hypothetical protein
MGTKENPGEFDCYDKAQPDEPMFVLLARDPAAPSLIRRWASIRQDDIINGLRPDSDRGLVYEALVVARAMEVWRVEADHKWRKPKEEKTCSGPILTDNGFKRCCQEHTFCPHMVFSRYVNDVPLYVWKT